MSNQTLTSKPVFMKPTKIFPAFLLLIFLLNCSFSNNEGYKIEVKIEGLSEAECYLAYHFGNRQYLQDTTMADAGGLLVFEGPERLDPGMYLVVLPGQQYFEIIVDQNQHFSLETKMGEFVPAMEFENSPDNQAFYEYLRFVSAKGQEVGPLREELHQEDTSPERIDEIREKLAEADQQVREKQNEYMEAFPDGLFTKVLLAQQEPEVPEAGIPETPEPGIPVDENEALRRQYQQYKNKFWNNIDFSDDRLLRTPVFHSMLNRYFNNVVIQVPDTVIKEADRIVDKARANDEVFKYVIWFLTNNAERSEIMGMDAVFVHMVEEYYMSGEAFWVEPDNLERIAQRAMRLKPLLIGNTAPDIEMYTRDGETLSLHDVEAEYLVIYFWDSDCPHCKRVTPALRDLYHRKKDQGVKVFAVNTEADRENWIKSKEEYNLDWINVNDIHNRSGFRDKYDIYSIPLLFLLDSEKTIMAKRITVDQIEEIITREIEQNR